MQQKLEFITVNNRLVTVLGGIPFYQSTGQNSGEQDTWFPFSGVSNVLAFGIGWFIKPDDKTPSTLKDYFPQKLTQYFQEKYSLLKKLAGRFGNYETLCLSMLIGGGFWNSREGQELKEFIENNYPEDLALLAKIHEEGIKQIQQVKDSDQSFDAYTQGAEVNDWLIKHHSIADKIGYTNFVNFKYTNLRTVEPLPERMQHPQAKLIPESIWSDPKLFANSLDESVLALMNLSDEDLITRFATLPELSESRLPAKLRPAAFLAIALSHPNLPLSVFVACLTKFNFTFTYFNELLTILGYEEYILEYMQSCTPAYAQHLIYHSYDCYVAAVTHGQIRSIKRLETYKEIKDKIAANCAKDYGLAAANGQIEVMGYLETKDGQKNSSALDFNLAYSLAAKNGQLKAMIYLEKTGKLTIKPDFYCTVHSAAAFNGHRNVMQHLEAKATTVDQQLQMIAKAYHHAASQGRLADLLYFENKIQQLAPKKLKEIVMSDIIMSYRFAAMNGHLEVLQHLDKVLQPLEFQELKKIIGCENYKTYRLAAEKKQFPILEHLESRIKDDPDSYFHMLEQGDFITYQKAAQQGDLKKLKNLDSPIKWMYQRKRMIGAANFKAFELALENRHFEVCQHLVHNSADCFNHAAESATSQQIKRNDYSDGMKSSLNIHKDRCGYVLDLAFPEMLASLRQVMQEKRSDLQMKLDQAELYYAVLKYLIRLNQPGFDKEITFLISFPEIRILAQLEFISPYNDGHLTNFAIEFNNHSAFVAILASICEISKEQRKNLTEDLHFLNAIEHRGKRILSKELVQDLLALNQFYRSKRFSPDSKEFGQEYCDSIDNFYKKAMTIRLSSKPIKQQAKEIAQTAHDEFHHRHKCERLFADAMMLLSVLFGGLGLFIMAGRVLSGRTLFFSTALTNREEDLRKDWMVNLGFLENTAEKDPAQLFRFPASG